MKQLFSPFLPGHHERTAPESPDLFQEETRMLLAQRLHVGLVLGVVLIPMFSLLDFACLPGLAPRFLVYRLLCSIGFVLLLSVLNRPPGQRHPFRVALLAYLLAAATISAMIVQHGGYSSFYYAGLLMLLVTFCVLLPLKVSQTVLAGVIIFAVYVLPILALNTAAPDSLPIFTSNVFFFVFFILIMVILSKMETDTRVREFNLKTRLDSSREQLSYYAQHLEDEVERRARELEESELRYKELYENIIDMVVLIDDQGQIIRANHIFCQAMDLEAEPGEAQILSFVAEEDRPFVHSKVLSPLFEAREVRAVQFRMQPGPDKVSHVECNATRIVRGSRFIGSQLVIRDITERKFAEEERDRLEMQLQQAQKMESVGRLAGGVAHDLNNMLVGILGYGEMLLADTGLDERQKRRIELMHQAGLRSRDLVSQLLAFSRKQTLQMESLDVNQVLADFTSLVQKTIREDIEIRFNLSPDLPAVQADRSQLEQVILNLAVNAQDAMPEGGRLTIETGMADLDEDYAAHHVGVTPGRFVMLMVSDTGQGMDKEIQDQIFEPFFTTKNIGEGTGLGLATVYGIVKQHQGNIWVYSEPGLGTSFKIYLPVTGEAPMKRRVQPRVDQPEVRGQETVVVIEDDEVVRNLAVSALRDQGYTVMSAASGAQCLDLLKSYQGPFDLMLTDVIMPDMNGKALFEEVVRSFPKVKILYMSGYTGNVISHHGVLDEGVDFLQKPFSVQELRLKVREVLNQA